MNKINSLKKSAGIRAGPTPVSSIILSPPVPIPRGSYGGEAGSGHAHLCSGFGLSQRTMSGSPPQIVTYSGRAAWPASSSSQSRPITPRRQDRDERGGRRKGFPRTAREELGPIRVRSMRTLTWTQGKWPGSSSHPSADEDDPCSSKPCISANWDGGRYCSRTSTGSP